MYPKRIEKDYKIVAKERGELFKSTSKEMIAFQKKSVEVLKELGTINIFQGSRKFNLDLVGAAAIIIILKGFFK